MSANDKQIGGTHYRVVPGEQHWDRIYRMFGPGYLIGCATKYIERHKHKGGRQDLEKAVHYIEKLIELQYPETDVVGQELGSHNDRRAYPWQANIERMNRIFGVPCPGAPTMYMEANQRISAHGRLVEFKKIILGEVDEVDEIMALAAAGAEPLETLTALADWLADLQVYAASEMARWGLPIEAVLECVIESQWSKLDAYGNPIVQHGKFQKGPNYVPPEERIRELLADSVPSPRPISQRQTVEVHQDDVWQCEGYFGDGTQLYRQKADRRFVRCGSLDAAYAWHAAQSPAPPPQRTS